jgi:K+-sensing histidine kinase KdpD
MMVCVALICVLAVSTVYFLISLSKERNKYRELLQEGKSKYDALLKEYEEKLKNRIEEDKQRQLRDAASITHHLSNVISGMNHELSPWIGGIKNKISRLASKSKSSVISLSDISTKLNDILKACDSMSLILDNLSRDVKKIQKYDTFNSNIFDTVTSWVRLTITDRSIKENISEDNFIIEGETLLFNCHHSPLLVSQIILNLVKNSIEHNAHMLDKLKIQISGNADMKALIYEYNGKGIPIEKLETIFTPGMTTKNQDKELHGLGMSLCQDYCSTMGAVIVAEKCGSGARFVIYFESDRTKAALNSKVRRIKTERESSIRMACKLGENRIFDGRN